MLRKGCDETTTDNLVSFIDMSKLDVEDKTELLYLLDILGTVIRDTMCKLFFDENDNSAEEIKKALKYKVKSLKRHYSK